MSDDIVDWLRSQVDYDETLAADDYVEMDEDFEIMVPAGKILDAFEEITRLRAELATARREGMEEAAKRLEELHKNHGYNPQTGEVWSLGKIVTCPLTIDHSIGYYRAISEGVAHILRAAAGEGK